MPEPKTRPTRASVAAFLAQIANEGRRADCRKLDRLMRAVTGRRARMWGTSIVGYGSYRHRYASGRDGEWPLAAFSPRKQCLTIYVVGGLAPLPVGRAHRTKHTAARAAPTRENR